MSLDMEPLIKSISVHMRFNFKSRRDMIGVNLSALKLIEKEVQNQISGVLSLPEFRKPFSF
jgi:hypothetical protein